MKRADYKAGRIELMTLLEIHGKEINDLMSERGFQIAKFGNQEHRNIGQLFSILAEEFGEVAKEVNEIINSDELHVKGNKENYYSELVQLAATALQLMYYHNKSNN